MYQRDATSAGTSAEPGAGAQDTGFHVLDDLARIATELGATNIADQARAVVTRLDEQRFFVACVGQFKRGKSTLLNALVDRAVLPVGVAPVTSVVTILRYGTSASAWLRMLNGRTREIPIREIGQYVDERRNPRNRQGVAAVEVSLPSPILAGGLCLVDTPGVGSVFTANTEATRAFLPQIDAALVVLGADPPVSQLELELALEIAAEVEDLVIVLNKADRLTVEELAEARAFTHHVFTERLGHLAWPLEVSAWERVEHGRATRDWSGLEGRLTGWPASRGRASWSRHARGRRSARRCSWRARSPSGNPLSRGRSP